MSSERKILIAAGGSGGHIFPAVALARTLMRKGAVDILFMGSDKSLDRKIFGKEGFKFSALSGNKLQQGSAIRMPAFLIRLIIDTVRTLFTVISFKPDAVIGFGGYVSFPAVLMAYFFKIPTLVHEQNVVPGRANTILFKLADRIAISFEETRRYLGTASHKAVFTGNPVRPEIVMHDRDSGVRSMGLDHSKFTVLVIGGSQGAHRLNEAFVNALSVMDQETRSSLQIIHITGINDYGWAVKEYARLGMNNKVFSFIDRIEEAYGAADLVVTRAGASAMSEIALMGRPMILVPYPFAMSHQSENAKVFSRAGAAVDLNEETLSPEYFKENIIGLSSDRERLKRMSERARRMILPDASGKLAEEVVRMSGWTQ